MSWNMARNTENMKNEKCTLQNLEYGEKTDQQGKGETHMAGPGIQKHGKTWKMRNVYFIPEIKREK